MFGSCSYIESIIESCIILYDVSTQGEEKPEEEASQPGGPPVDKSKLAGGTQGKYVPPSMRDGGSKKGESMMSSRGRGEQVLPCCL